MGNHSSPSPHPQKGDTAHVYRGQTAGSWMDQDGTCQGGGPRSRPQCARWAHSYLYLPKKGTELLQYSAHVYCGQTAGWIKMTLSMEVGINPGDSVLDGDPAPASKKGAEPHNFDPCLLWPNGWMDHDATWYGGRPQPRRHCVRWGHSSPPLKGHNPQIFGQCPLWPYGGMD